MFGVVPRALWERTDPPDSANRIKLGLNCLLVRAHFGNVLVETGVGGKFSQKAVQMYGIQRIPSLETDLSRIGLSAGDIDHCILTHLHFDHAGGTTKHSLGNAVPTVPKATYHIQRCEWEAASNPDPRSKASYLPENVEPLQQTSVDLVDGDREILSGVRVQVTGGHTAAHQIVLFDLDGQTLCFTGDLIPTDSHVHTPFVMGYDLFPLDTMKAKAELVSRAIAEEWIIVTPHSHRVPIGRFVEKNGRPAMVRL